MRCPNCFKKLTPGRSRVYETLIEHVECRSRLPLRPTFICCCDRMKGVFWDEQGNFYGGTLELYRSLRFHGTALFSLSFYFCIREAVFSWFKRHHLGWIPRYPYTFLKYNLKVALGLRKPL